jgi:hypothetical protein
MKKLLAFLALFPVLAFAQTQSVQINPDTHKIVNPILDFSDVSVSGLGGGGSTTPTLLTPGTDLTLPVPLGTPTTGGKALFYITPSAGVALRFNEAIRIPSNSSFNNSTGKALASGKTYIVQLEYLGSAWGLTTIVGGY